MQTFDSIYFRNKNRFDRNDGMQNYLLFQRVYRYFKNITTSDHILAWESKALGDESIKLPAASNDSLAVALNYIADRSRVEFDYHCLIKARSYYSKSST